MYMYTHGYMFIYTCTCRCGWLFKESGCIWRVFSLEEISDNNYPKKLRNLMALTRHLKRYIVHVHVHMFFYVHVHVSMQHVYEANTKFHTCENWFYSQYLLHYASSDFNQNIHNIRLKCTKNQLKYNVHIYVWI